MSLERDSIYLLLMIASVHAFKHETTDLFNSILTFSYSKYFVHSYTIDVVFILSDQRS